MKSFLICVFILSTIPVMNSDFLGNQNFYSDQVRANIKNRNEISSSNGYLLVDPINISSGSDWANYPFITGNGSASNPYVIENVEIIGDGVKTVESGNDTLLDYWYFGILINAGGSFVIRNSKISNFSMGIHVSISASAGMHSISNVEISDCSIGLQSNWFHVDLNISNCFIHDCSWVSIMSKINFNSYIDYGGFGIFIRSDGSIIENCRIEDCSVGMVAGLVQEIHNNEFIRCGIVPYWYYMFDTNYGSSNTVNGKPIGIFWGIDNWVVTNASLYGQLIFASCSNLTLENVHITEPCSIAIQVFSSAFQNQTNIFRNIIVENQKLGMYFTGGNFIGDNLYTKNCEAGFFFNHIAHCEFTRLKTNNTEVPIYMLPDIVDCSFEIEKSTKFYLIEGFASYQDKLQIEPGDDVSLSYITELGWLGYAIQINELGTFALNLTIPSSHNSFTVISIPHNARPIIPAGLDPGVIVVIVGISIGGGIALVALAYFFFKKRKM